MPTRLVGILVDALFPSAADALAGTLDEVGGRLLFGGGGGSTSPLPLLALGVVARPAEGAKSTAKVQVRVEGVRESGNEGSRGRPRLPRTVQPHTALFLP